jgi:hypothetical protein
MFGRRAVDTSIGEHGATILADLEILIDEAVRSGDDVRVYALDRVLQGVEHILKSAGAPLPQPMHQPTFLAVGFDPVG